MSTKPNEAFSLPAKKVATTEDDARQRRNNEAFALPQQFKVVNAEGQDFTLRCYGPAAQARVNKLGLKLFPEVVVGPDCEPLLDEDGKPQLKKRKVSDEDLLAFFYLQHAPLDEVNEMVYGDVKAFRIRVLGYCEEKQIGFPALEKIGAEIVRILQVANDSMVLPKAKKKGGSSGND